MILHIIYPVEQEFEMTKKDDGFFSVTVEGITDGSKYYYKPEGVKDYPDPASGFQPSGVHGPSQVVDHSAYRWSDAAWHGIPQKDLIFIEIHTGTFSKEGTFEAIIPYLDVLTDTGINAIELMPVSQFPGERNWGYDGVFPYAVQNSYGGPEGLKKLVDACHNRGIAVFLDVVYNHLGPEGNYLSAFGPYFSKKYNAPWGDTPNFDDAWSDGVRDYFSDNPCYWSEYYHIDGLRVDAIHMMFDNSAMHFWELANKKIEKKEQELGRKFCMIAECDLNSPKVVKSPEYGGYGFDSQWLDDFHHALYVILHKEGKNRYEDFGRIEQLAKAYTDGFVHSGEYVSFRRRKHGVSSAGLPGEKFVVFNQNHDQVGNRVKGERLSVLVDFERQKIASAAILLSPYIPLLFMGEEYGEDTPFFYFVSHSDEDIIKSVREGRKKEFASYKWDIEPPDPQDQATFDLCRIDPEKRKAGNYSIVLQWNKELIRLRRIYPALRNTDKNDLRVYLQGNKGFVIHRKSSDEKQHLLCFFNFSERDTKFHVPEYSEKWTLILDSKDNRWNESPEILANNDVSREIKQHHLCIRGTSVAVYVNK